MIAIMSLPASQPRSLSPQIALRLRRRSHKSAPGAVHRRRRRENSDAIADEDSPFALLHHSRSAVTMASVIPTPRRCSPPTHKSP
ncbi:hypothetical protein CQW49_23135 (plasmid) [Methylosinus trichosporium OB3b]|uniref:Uncharacterized protein n=1 Tax=Methylosinus trichosporium (strain ATCC 35070 / NCIMB 11131 / UNIQEM 75 / OB3b) TaxID=595536 RepID=A0A2D2D7C6_METT3|nr:hypothetical protein CQW49_23135 [Methylosinus trichosporium OB3b]